MYGLAGPRSAMTYERQVPDPARTRGVTLPRGQPRRAAPSRPARPPRRAPPPPRPSAAPPRPSADPPPPTAGVTHEVSGISTRVVASEETTRGRPRPTH